MLWQCFHKRIGEIVECDRYSPFVFVAFAVQTNLQNSIVSNRSGIWIASAASHLESSSNTSEQQLFMNAKICSLLSFVLSIVAGGCFLPVVTQAQESSSGSTVKVRLIGSKVMLTEPIVVPKVQKTDAEWRKQLTAEKYAIARGQGTEPA